MKRHQLFALALLFALLAACSGDADNSQGISIHIVNTPTPPAEGTAPGPPPVDLTTVPSAANDEEARERAGTTSDTLLAPPPAVPAAAGRLDVFFIDVSLGDAIYVRTPGGQDVIIDGGDSPNELSAFLDQIGERGIDIVIASHPHADHIGGLPRVVRERTVGAVWSNGEIYTTKLYKELEAAISGKGLQEHAAKLGETFDLGGARFTVLAPSRVGSNINDNSLVIRMDCGTSSFLFAGDAETASESTMVLTQQALLNVDVLKLGHHGSRSSTSSQMVLATTPKLAIYQARVGNTYGHPHKETLDRLAAQKVPVDGTGLAGGTVVVSTACDGQYSVTPKFGDFPTSVVTSPPPSVLAQPAPANPLIVAPLPVPLALVPAPQSPTAPPVAPTPTPRPVVIAPTAAPVTSCDGFTSQKVRDWCRRPAGNTINCSDFATRSEASRFTRTVDVADLNRLDADHDGVSCETLPP